MKLLLNIIHFNVLYDSNVNHTLQENVSLTTNFNDQNLLLTIVTNLRY